MELPSGSVSDVLLQPLLIMLAMLIILMGVITKKIFPAPQESEVKMSEVYEDPSESDADGLDDRRSSSAKLRAFSKPESSRPSVRFVPNNEQNAARSKLQRNLAQRNQTAPHLHDANSLQVQPDARAAQSEHIAASAEDVVNAFRGGKKRSVFGELVKTFFFKKKEDNSSAVEDGRDDDQEGESPGDPARVSFTRGRRMGAAGIEDNVNLKTLSDLHASTVSMGNLGQHVNSLQQSIKKWKVMKMSENKLKMDSIALNRQHQAIIDEITHRAQTEVPLPLQRQTREEALLIVTKMKQQYKRILGNKNQLTKDAIHREKEIRCAVYGELY